MVTLSISVNIFALFSVALCMTIPRLLAGLQLASLPLLPIIHTLEKNFAA